MAVGARVCGGRAQVGGVNAIGGGWVQQVTAAGWALPWMVIVVVATEHPCMAVAGCPGREGR